MVNIRDVKRVGNVLILDTDRSFTGQDGEVVTPGQTGSGVPGMLATGLFGLGLGIDHIFVQQNAVTLRRPGGWDEAAEQMVSDVTRSFLLHYSEEEE